MRAAWPGRKGKWVRLPPQPLRKEAPLEKLPTRDGEAVELSTALHNRDDARGFLADFGHREAVT